MLAPDRVKSRKPLVGTPKPRLAPPLPARSAVKEFQASAAEIGFSFFPWQVIAGRYIYALGMDQTWLYPEVAAIVSRQQGKTKILVPHVRKRLKMGRRILHAGQHTVLPRDTFKQLVPIIEREYGKRATIRQASGQESIEVPGGGVYRIVAATGGAPRGWSADDLIVDELREIDVDFIEGAEPTVAASMNPQILYLSNAGSEESHALNAVRQRAQTDPSLAYLEWSADPGLASDDMAGWLQANPSIGHLPGMLGNIERAYESHKLAGTLAAFETERLCRWVATMRERLVQPEEWEAQEFGPAGRPARPVMAVKMDIDGERAAAVVSWLLPDSRVALAVVADVVGAPIDVTLLGPALVAKATEWGASVVAFDPYTDTDLMRYFRRSEKVIGRDYANASEGFARRVADRKFVVDDDAGAIARDLDHTTRHHGQFGTWIAVKSQQPNPVAEAAIRAAWLASKPSSAEVARIY